MDCLVLGLKMTTNLRHEIAHDELKKIVDFLVENFVLVWVTTEKAYDELYENNISNDLSKRQFKMDVFSNSHRNRELEFLQ